MTEDPRIERLERFKALLHEQNGGARNAAGPRTPRDLRTQINQEKAWVQREVIEAGCFVTVTIGPPPALGGLVASNTNPFDAIFNPPYGANMIPTVIDMVDHTIGVLREPPPQRATTAPTIDLRQIPNYAFVAMPIDPASPELGDVLDAIKEACNRCGVRAERVDEPASSERITDRILESIRSAEFVIVDLTASRPNVYYEAGFAHGVGKLPIYIARSGTNVGFDLKDYPVIFFDSLRQLKDELERRLRGIATRAAT